MQGTASLTHTVLPAQWHFALSWDTPLSCGHLPGQGAAPNHSKGASPSVIFSEWQLSWDLVGRSRRADGGWEQQKPPTFPTFPTTSMSTFLSCWTRQWPHFYNQAAFRTTLKAKNSSSVSFSKFHGAQATSLNWTVPFGKYIPIIWDLFSPSIGFPEYTLLNNLSCLFPFRLEYSEKLVSHTWTCKTLGVRERSRQLGWGKKGQSSCWCMWRFFTWLLLY